MEKKINLIFMGWFTYPKGMAATKRIQNIINSLKECSDDISMRVILQRQSSMDNILSGVHQGTPYETVMGDLLRARLFAALPVLYYRTIMALKKAFRLDRKNIIFFYGPIFFDSLIPLKYAKRLGYKIIFDVNEDIDLEISLARSIYSSLRTRILINISLQIRKLSSGIVAISSHLENKCRSLTNGKMPVYYLPISVDMDFFPPVKKVSQQDISLFYAGSFAVEDGVPVLIDAFDSLADKYKNIRLVFSGKGSKPSMDEFHERVEMSPHKERIEYKGYLDEQAYYSLLNNADIPCMTRVDIAYSHAGFPFKLGEYLATGKPVIASRVSDVERFLTDKHNALLVQPGSSSDICDAVDFIIKNLETAVQIGLNGRKVAETFFDYKKQGAVLLDLFRNIS